MTNIAMYGGTHLNNEDHDIELAVTDTMLIDQLLSMGGLFPKDTAHTGPKLLVMTRTPALVTHGCVVPIGRLWG